MQGPFDDEFRDFAHPPMFYPTVKEVEQIGEVRTSVVLF
jgi:hypothetical protein